MTHSHVNPGLHSGTLQAAFQFCGPWFGVICTNKHAAQPRGSLARAWTHRPTSPAKTPAPSSCILVWNEGSDWEWCPQWRVKINDKIRGPLHDRWFGLENMPLKCFSKITFHKIWKMWHFHKCPAARENNFDCGKMWLHSSHNLLYCTAV